MTYVASLFKNNHTKSTFITRESFSSLPSSNDQKPSYITLECFLLTQIAAIGIQQLYLTLAISAFTSQYDSSAPSNAAVLHLGLFDLVKGFTENISWALARAITARIPSLIEVEVGPGYSLTLQSEFKWNRAEGIIASERHADESGWESREPKTKAVSKD